MAELPTRVRGEWVCAGVCAVERASEPRAGRSSQRSTAPAATAGPGSSEVGGPCRQPARGVPHWPPAGRPPPGRRRGAEGCSAAGAGELSRADAGRTRAGSASSLAASLRSRRRPARSRRWRLPLASDSAPEGPGQLPGARVSGRARLSGSSRAPPPAFAFAAAARRGLPRQPPGPPGRPRRGKLDCGEKWDHSREGPPASWGGWKQVARAGRFVSRRGDRERAAAPPSAAPFPPLLPRAAASRVGRVTERESPGMCLWGLRDSREERRWPGRCGSREVARGLHRRCRQERDASSEQCSARARASFFRGAPGGGELGGRVCAEKEEAGRPATSGADFDPSPAPCFRGSGPWGAVVLGPKRARAMRGWGRPWLGFNKECSSPPGGEGQLRRGGLQQVGLSPGERYFLWELSFCYSYYLFFFFKGRDSHA